MIDEIIKVIQSVSRLCALLAGFLIAAMTAANSYAVVARYGFNHPVEWIMDISELLMVTSVFLGTAYVFQTEGHVRVDLLVEILSKRARRIVLIVGDFATAALLIILVWKTWEVFMANLYTRSGSVMRFPLFPGYATVFLGSCFLLLQGIIKCYLRCKQDAQ